MAEISNNGLFCIKEKIRRFDCIEGMCDRINVIVVEVHRYTNDVEFGPWNRSFDLFDITISDNKEKCKCFLSPKLNLLVHSRNIYPGCIICIDLKKCDVRYDETDIHSASIIIVNDFSSLGPYEGSINPDVLHYNTLCSSKESSRTIPLTTKRANYLSNYCNEDPYGLLWHESDLDSSEERPDYNSMGQISELSNTWKKCKRTEYLPLVVRILHRARLRYFGTPKRSDRWPYQAYFEVADKGGHCTMVLWNTLCPEFYNSLSEGVLIYIKNYTVRERFQLMSSASLRNSDLLSYNIELNINKHHPVGFIKILQENKIPGNSIPAGKKYHFLTRKDMSALPDGYNLDVVGIVTYVGRFQRLRKDNDSGFWLYRWIEFFDGSSPLSTRVEIFATSQPEVHSDIVPGCVLICTQMRLIHQIQLRSPETRILYVTTTNESQIYVEEKVNIKGPYKDDNTVQEVVRWGLSAVPQKFIGGYYKFPHLEKNFKEYKASFKKITNFKMIPIFLIALVCMIRRYDSPRTCHQKYLIQADSGEVLSSEQLQAEIESLHYREFRRVHFQGFIVYVEQSRNEHTRTGERPIADPSEDNTTSSDDEIPYQKRQRLGLRKHCCTSNDNGVIVDEVYQQLVSRTCHTLGTGKISSEYYSREYSDRDQDVLVSQINMPPVVFCGTVDQDRTLSDLPIAKSHANCLRVIITSLNQNIMINTALLLPTLVSEDITFKQVLCGEYLDDTTTEINQNVISHLMNSSKHLRDERMLFILDLYSYGNGHTEITLNQAYTLDVN